MKIFVLLLTLLNLNTGFVPPDRCTPYPLIPLNTSVKFHYRTKIGYGVLIAYQFAPRLPSGRCEFKYRIRVNARQIVTVYPVQIILKG